MALKDVFVPILKKIKVKETVSPAVNQVNLADDEKLVKEVVSTVDNFFTNHAAKRKEYEDLWIVADEMWKCGQTSATRGQERLRLDRQSDSDIYADTNKTKAYKAGSTQFFKQVRSLAAQLIDVVNSKRDPFTYTSLRNPNVPDSGLQADGQATQHNLLMRWTRDADGFDNKTIDIAHQLLKYGNVPIYMYWKIKNAMVLNRWKKGKKPFRKEVAVDYRPSLGVIPNENFYADPAIGDIQKQQCIVVKSQENMMDIRSLARQGEYKNAEKMGVEHEWGGGDTDDVSREKEANAGIDSETDRTTTGLTMQYDAHLLLPIDESKPKGKRWDAEKNEPQKYWVTIVSSDQPDTGLCLRIERNRDPDDEYPFAMLNSIPDDTDKLYKLSLAQVLRGNFTEASLAKQQMFDANTLQNNRPLKKIRGEVYGTDDMLRFQKDNVIEMENKDSLTEFALAPNQNNLPIVQYLDGDSDEAAGNNRAVRGDPMGGRTSSAEATNAFESASKPQMMVIKYILNQYLGFYARKGIRLWDIYAKADQVLQIADEEKYPIIRPAELFGDFNVKLTLVDEYSQNMVERQNTVFAVQNILPLFIDVLDKRETFKIIADKVLNWNTDKIITPDRSDQERLEARREDRMMTEEGRLATVEPDDIDDVHLKQHRGTRVRYRGVEDEFPQAKLLDRHIAEHEAKQARGASQAGAVQPIAPPENATSGQVAGNEIAAQAGALAGGG